MEDRTSGGRELETAMLTAVHLAGGNAVELGFALASFAGDDFRKPLGAEILKAGVIIREHLVELLESELYHRAFLVGHFSILHHEST